MSSPQAATALKTYPRILGQGQQHVKSHQPSSTQPISSLSDTAKDVPGRKEGGRQANRSNSPEILAVTIRAEAKEHAAETTSITRVGALEVGEEETSRIATVLRHGRADGRFQNATSRSCGSMGRGWDMEHLVLWEDSALSPMGE